MMDSMKKAFVLSLKAANIFCVIILFNIIVNAINLMIIPAPVNAEMTPHRFLAVIGAGLVFFLLAIFIQGGIIAYIKELVKTGSVSLAPFLGNSAKYFLRMLSIVLITILIALGWGVLFFGIIPAMVPVLKVVSIIIGLIVLIGIMILLILPAYALVGSDLGAMASIRKGVAITAANFLKVVGILLILIVVGAAAMFIASFITGLLSIMFKNIVNYVAAIVMAVSSAIVTLLADIAYMDFYLKKS